MAPPRALLFDVFGTLVDWRASIARAGQALGDRLGLPPTDWAALADAWRACYDPGLEPVRAGERAWVTLDVLHRESLDALLPAHGLEAMPGTARADLVAAWHRLDPWPDVAEGLRRLRARHLLAPCSNGHVALQVHLARHAGLVWDAVLGAELARTYKPRPEVYLRSVEALGLEPPEVLMVAAHPSDLAAAARCGLRTAWVARPDEHGPGAGAEPPTHDVDHRADDLLALAAALDFNRG